MVKVNLGGCSSFVNDAEYKAYVEKAFAAYDVLENETGAGNDFLGWKNLPSQTLAGTLVDECEAVREGRFFQPRKSLPAPVSFSSTS